METNHGLAKCTRCAELEAEIERERTVREWRDRAIGAEQERDELREQLRQAKARVDDFRKCLEWKNKLTAEHKAPALSPGLCRKCGADEWQTNALHGCFVCTRCTFMFGFKDVVREGMMRALEDSPSRRARERIDARIAACRSYPGPCLLCGADELYFDTAVDMFRCARCAAEAKRESPSASKIEGAAREESRSDDCDCGGPAGHVPGGIECRRAL